MIAFPAAALVLAGLLRSPSALPARLAAARGPLAHARRRRSSAGSASSPASPPARCWRWPPAPSRAPRPSFSASSAAARSSSSPGCSTTPVHLPPIAKLGAQFAAAAVVLAAGVRVEIVEQRRARAGAGARLARRDDERLQPARQHGRARGDARRDRGRASSRSTPSRSTRTAACSSLSLALLRAASAFLPFNLRPGRRARGVHGRLRRAGARLRARGARARVELEGRRNDGRDAAAADARARRADPRHDARHGRAPARGPADLPGRPRPHLAPARVPRPLGEARRRAAGARSPPRSARRASPTTCSTTRRSRSSACWSRSRCSSSSRASSPTSSAARVDRERPTRLPAAGVRRALAAPGRGGRRLRADHGVVLRARTCCVVGRARRVDQRARLRRARCRSCSPRATSPSSRSASTAASGATPARATRRAIAGRGRVSEVVAFGFVALTRSLRRLLARVLRRRRAALHRR